MWECVNVFVPTTIPVETSPKDHRWIIEGRKKKPRSNDLQGFFYSQAFCHNLKLLFCRFTESSFKPQAVFDTEGKGGRPEVEAVHLGFEAGDAGGAYLAGADDVLQVDADIALLADSREVERQRHNKVPRGERVDIVGAAPRGGEEDVAGAHAEAHRRFKDEELGQGDAVAEVDVEMHVVLLDELVLHCDTAAAIRPIDIQPQGEPAILYPGTDAALYGAEVCAAVIERGKIALHVVGKTLAAVEEAGAEVQVGPDIPFRFHHLVFLCTHRATSQYTGQQHKAFQAHFLKQYFHTKHF